MNQEQIGKTILEIRKKNNMTQKDLADKLNVTAQAVSKWENGRGIPDIEILQKLSKEFNINLDTLLNGNNQKKSHKKFYIIIIILLIIILSMLLFLLFHQKDFNFSDITSNNKDFSVSGVAAYSKDKNSIYISDIEYKVEKEDKKYIGVECILYESHDNVEEKVSQYGNIDKELSPKTLKEILDNTEFKVESFTCPTNINETNLYISINLKDRSGSITTYKIPLQLTGSCN